MADERQINNPALSLESLIAALDQSIAARRPAAPAHSPPPQLSKLAAPGKYIVFSMAEARYAIPINHVVEVGEPQRITPVPNVPDWVLGVTNLRGDIVSVVDCGAFLHLHEKSKVEMSSMCVVRNQKRSLVTSLIVDHIEGLVNLSGDLIALPANTLEDRVVAYLQGIYEHGGQLLNILNLEGLLASLELTE